MKLGSFISSYDELLREYGSYGKKFERALQLVSSRSIKLHRFLPSGRELWTAVGREGDQLVDDGQPFCSCRDFYYRVMGEKEDLCYHLLGLRMAKRSGEFDTITFHDAEYSAFLMCLLDGIGKKRKAISKAHKTDP